MSEYTQEELEKIQKVFEDTNIIIVETWNIIAEFLRSNTTVFMQSINTCYQCLMDSDFVNNARSIKMSKKKINAYMRYMNEKR